MTTPTLPDNDYCPWAQSSESVLEAFSADPDRGLTTDEVSRRTTVFGPNQLRAANQHHLLSILVAQFRSIVIVLLAAAGFLALLFGEFAEGYAIFAVIIINGAIGFVTEWRAVRSMESLRQFAHIDCVALRDGTPVQLYALALVPGDIVLLDAGDLVPADLRLIEAAKLQADESTLTGESLPERKHIDALAADVPVLDRENTVYRGTSITRGTGKGVVVATGMRTEFGKIFDQISAAEPQQTPLEKRLDALGRRLAWAVIAMAVLVAAAGMLAGRETFLAIEVAIALSVAAIPEGLPIVATVALARGMWRMAQRNALVTRLSAVETLGATSVIMTDKTGTLTENRMTATTVQLDGAEITVTRPDNGKTARFLCDGREIDEPQRDSLDALLRTATLCSNASLQSGPDGTLQETGDPTELALLLAASGRGIWRQQLLESLPEIREEAFDPDAKRMATLHRADGEIVVAVKGAPETIVPVCTKTRTTAGDRPLDDRGRQSWIDRADQLGDRGLRTIAIATRSIADDAGNLYTDLTLLGIAGLEDPARAGVDQAIARCREAGVTVVMVTGDHAATARNVATKVGIVDADADARIFVNGTDVDKLLTAPSSNDLLKARVFSRVTPEQKLKLIDLFQRAGHVVAMTGDGVNDAPALKKAEIGVAMGLRGTAVAKEAAAMVLQDDEFSSIVAAISHGRAIFANIRKFVVYLLSCNISEVLVVSLATIAGAPLPLLPLQILFLNLVTDVFPALALGVGPGSPTQMNREPRPASERVLTRVQWTFIAADGVVIAAAVLAAMAVSIFLLGFDSARAVTVSFCTLALAQMWHVFNMRDEMRRWINNEITHNAWIWIALGICLVLLLTAVYTPVLQQVLELTHPGLDGWLLIVAASLVPVFVAPVVRYLATHKTGD